MPVVLKEFPTISETVRVVCVHVRFKEIQVANKFPAANFAAHICFKAFGLKSRFPKIENMFS